MKINPVEPVYKSTFNTRQNPNRQQDKKDKKKNDFAAILKISEEGRKKAKEMSERDDR